MDIKWDVFVSYSHKDAKYVSIVVKDLKEAGLHVWQDVAHIDYGERLRDRINEGIRNSASFLIFISLNSIRSQMVLNELDTAMIKEIEDCRRFVMPVLMGRANARILPLDLKGKLWIDLRYNFKKRYVNSNKLIVNSIRSASNAARQETASSLSKEAALEQLVESANILVKQEHYMEAADQYEKACFKAINDEVSKERLGSLYIATIGPSYVIGQYGKCICLAKKVIQLYEEESDINSCHLQDAYKWLAKIYGGYGDYKKALKYVDKAEQTGINPHALSLTKGQIMDRLGKWPEAEELFLDALGKGIGTEGPATVHNTLAWLYIRQGRYDKATEHCLESIRLRNSATESTRGIAFCNAYLADFFIELKQWNNAEFCLITASQLFTKIGALQHAAWQHYNHAILALQRDNDSDKAWGHAQKFVKYFQDLPFKREHAKGKRLLAKVCAGTDDMENAQQYLEESIKILRSIGEKYELGLSYYELGNVNQNLGNEREARQYLLKSRVIFNDLQALKKYRQVEKALAQLSKKPSQNPVFFGHSS